MPDKVTGMMALLEKRITDGRSTTGAPQKIDVEVLRRARQTNKEKAAKNQRPADK